MASTNSPQIVRPSRKISPPRRSATDYLPAIPPPPKTQMPRRYEQTKPVIVQNFTHTRIIGLGELINRRNAEEAEEERQIAVDNAIERTWEEADIIKEQAVRSAREKALLEQEKTLRKIQRVHDRAIKEETLRVEAVMQRTLRETLEAEKVAAEKRLETAVAVVREQCYEELLQAVNEARLDEQAKSEEACQKIQDAAAAKLSETITALTCQREAAINALEQKKEEEKVIAVAEAHIWEQNIAADNIKKLKDCHAVEIENIKQEITSREDKILEKDQQLVLMQEKREMLFNELLKVQADYQNFIDKHPLFDPGQSGYLLPNIIQSRNIEDPRQLPFTC